MAVMEHLMRGYTHWASGRIDRLEANTQNLQFCHIQSVMMPSMKSGSYCDWLMLGHTEAFATLEGATCDCAAGWVYVQANEWWLSYLYSYYIIYYINTAYGLICMNKPFDPPRRKSAAHMYQLFCMHLSPWQHCNSNYILRNHLATSSADEESQPVISLPCQWKPPRKTNESALPLSDASFEKHEFGNEKKSEATKRFPLMFCRFSRSCTWASSSSPRKD